MRTHAKANNTQAQPNSSTHAQGASAHTHHCSRLLHSHSRRQPLALLAHTLIALALQAHALTGTRLLSRTDTVNTLPAKRNKHGSVLRSRFNVTV